MHTIEEAAAAATKPDTLVPDPTVWRVSAVSTCETEVAA
jgi:hypothetical protein